MNLCIEGQYRGLSFITGRWLRQMHSPLCGLDQRINFVAGALESSQTATVGAELAGVHALFEGPRRSPGSYHIGASGLFLEEILVRTLGETAERYAQITAEHFAPLHFKFSCFDEMQADPAGFRDASRTIAETDLSLFAETSFNRPEFPFSPFDRTVPLGWVEMQSLVSARQIWVPAQMALVGYRARKQLGERKFFSSVTTGTAAHRSHDLAMLNGILELIQIDSAVGHWYSAWPCLEIIHDSRTATVQRLIHKYGGRCNSVGRPTFLSIANPDLIGFTIACVFRGPSGISPTVAVGLGCGLNLSESIYKAWLEALGVWHLASLNVLQQRRSTTQNPSADGVPRIYDLDTNVGYYARGRGRGVLESRFSPAVKVPASELPDDIDGSVTERLGLLIRSFASSGKELYRIDLTSTDLANMGLVVERVWSPDTLSLPLPSAPPTLHRRFKAFGGFRNEHPHPYP